MAVYKRRQFSEEKGICHHGQIYRAIQAEVSGFMSEHAHLLDDEGRQRLVPHGFLPERAVMTGIGVRAALYPFRPQAKTMADHTLIRSLMTMPVTIQPPPLHAMNGVACSGSFFAQEPKST